MGGGEGGGTGAGLPPPGIFSGDPTITQNETCTDSANDPTKTTARSQLTALQSQQRGATTPRQPYKNNPVHPRTQRPYNNNPHTQQPHNKTPAHNSHPRFLQILPQPPGRTPAPPPRYPQGFGCPSRAGAAAGAGPESPRLPGGSP